MNRRTLTIAIIIAASVYLFVSTAVYRFRNPGKTETELFLEIPRALTWSTT